MLGSNATKAKINDGKEVFGILNSVPSPLLCEMFGYAGYDFVIIDTEHVLLSDSSLEQSIRAAENAGITPLVRIPSSDSALIARALDNGAQGIVIPRVSSVEQAREAINAVKFPPLGRRGITGGRTTGFGTLGLDDYISRANQEIMLVLMIEDPIGCEALPQILQLSGIDAILEGALDLSIAMGHGSDVQHPNVQAAIQQMADDCTTAQTLFCALPRQPEEIKQWRLAGVKMFLTGEDRGILFRQLKAHLSSF
jgi:2-keto-3-deoxy-L-rhamnonate aldolase RhmA